MNRAQKSQQETTNLVKLDRQQKRMAAKKCTSYRNKKTKTTKRTGYGKPNYQKIKKHDEVLRKAARHTRLIKASGSLYYSTLWGSLGLYDGFLGSQRDYFESGESEYLDPFLPNLNGMRIVMLTLSSATLIESFSIKRLGDFQSNIRHHGMMRRTISLKCLMFGLGNTNFHTATTTTRETITTDQTCSLDLFKKTRKMLKR